MRNFFAKRAKTAILLSPTILCGIYYFGIASDQYQSEVLFVLRSAGRPNLSAGVSFMVQLGLMRSEDDSFVVENYLTSRDALTALKAKLPIAEMYNREGTDFLARYPSIAYGSEDEQFYKYYEDQIVSVTNGERTGVMTLTVDAFRPEDARLIAETLMSLSEDFVNRINERITKDAIAASQAEVASAQARVVSAQTAITEFRNKELMVDPKMSASALAELISNLRSELSSVRLQINQLHLATPSASPQLNALQTSAAALEQQIASEQTKIARDKGGLAQRVAQFDSLTQQREFAYKTLTAAEADLVRARAEAKRRYLYLERIAGPSLPDYAALPQRLRRFITALVVNIVLASILWVVSTGVREHASHGA
jgi:capsular polysaccharide transport system permease protein